MTNENVPDIVQRAVSTLAPPEMGIGVSVVSANGPIFGGAFGLRDRERKLPVTTRTVFELASLAKAVTATAVLLATDERLLSIDAPLAALTPLLSLGDAEVSRRLSLTDLLSHRTGLPPHDLLWYFAPPRYTTRDLVSRLKHLPLIAGGSRETFVYNNLLYGAVAVLFDEIFAQDWEAFVSGRIFSPASMQSSSFRPALEETDVAQGYVGTTPVARKDASVIAAAAGLRSTVGDIAAWLSLQLRRGESVTGKRLIERESFESLHRARIAIRDRNPLLFQGLEWLGDAEYALGWFVGRAFGRKALFHPAFIDGFSAAVVFVPDLDIGIAVMSNANLSPIPGLIIERVLAEHSGHPVPEAPSQPAATAPPAPEIAATPVSESYAGRYEHAAYGTLEITASNDRGVVLYGDQRWPLELQSPDAGVLTVTAFGVTMLFPCALSLDGDRVTSISIPLAGDPRVVSVVFTRS